MYECPQCGRYGMEWDGRAKVLLCHYHSCRHVIRNVEMLGKIPTPAEIEAAITKEKQCLQKDGEQ